MKKTKFIETWDERETVCLGVHTTDHGKDRIRWVRQSFGKPEQRTIDFSSTLREAKVYGGPQGGIEAAHDIKTLHERHPKATIVCHKTVKTVTTFVV